MKQKDEELEREFDCSQVFTEVESVLPKVMVDFEHRIGIQKICCRCFSMKIDDKDATLTRKGNALVKP